MAGQPLKGGILHPRAALHWRNCHKPLWNSHYFPRSCAILHDKVAILTSGYHILTSGYHALRDVLHISSTTSLDSWAPVALPYQFMSLATYQSKFVAVGGRDHRSYEPTNVCTSISGLKWESTLPPMPTKRYMTSSVSARDPEALVVAGGKNTSHRRMKVIEVLLGDKWTSVDLLPSPDCGMHSAFHDGKIFFMRNKKTNGTAYFCNFSSLISLDTRSSEDTVQLWEHLQTPGEKTTVGAIVSFSSNVVSINGNAIVRAYSSTAKSWVKATSVGKKSKRHGYHIAASSFSTREIVFTHRRGGVYLLQLSISPFSLKSDFTPNILTRLEASGLDVATLLKGSHSTQGSSFNLQEIKKVLLHWSDGLIGDRPPCWEELQRVLNNGGLKKLSRIIFDLLQVQVEIVQDQIENNRESENLKYYLSQIPERFHENLDEEIDDEILSKTAESLTGWIYKYDLLELNDDEMKAIKLDNDSAESQRKAALMHWKNELGLLSTYRNLLVICIRGNWQDSAKEIVTFVKKGSRHRQTSYSGSEQSERNTVSGQKRHSESSDNIGSSKRPRIERKSSLDGISDTEEDFSKSQKRHFESSENIGSSKRPRIESKSLDNISDTGVDFSKKFADKKIAFLTALSVIVDVRKYVNLAIQLKVTSAKIDEINQYPPEEHKTRIIQAWFDHDRNPTYKTLYQALLMPSVDDKRAAMRLFPELSSSMDSSISVDGESSSVNATRGSLDDVSLCPKKELKSINEATIRKEYSSLTKKIIRTLQKVDIKELKHDIANIFDPEDVSDDIISSSSDLYEIFRQLTKKHFWSFSDINKLTALAELHIEDDSEIEKAIEKYNDDLIGYKTCTLIGEKINFDSMQQESDEELGHEKDEFTEGKDPSYYNITTRKKLVVTILEREGGGLVNVSDLCLLYVENIFKKMKRRFNLKLDAVLKKVATGIEITWYIPSISAWTILNQLPESLQFLREEGISTMFLEDVLIFSNFIGVINSKELKELQLLLAVQDKNSEQAISLMKDCSEILNEAQQSHGRTLLMTASFRGSVNIISSLIDHEASINVQDAYGWTALAYALVAGKQEAFNFLIRKGATLTLESKGSKYKNILDLIRRHQLYISEDNLNQSLILASKSGELKFVEKFIEMGADVTAVDQDKEGRKALTWASFNGHLDVVKHLVDSGSELNVECGENNWTALQLASRNGFHEIVEYLLDHGADVNKKTKIGWSPLRFAAARNYTKTGEILLERKADVYSLDHEHEYTPMNQAAQDGCAEFISMMMRKVPHYNLEFTAKKSGGWTPLMLACKNGHVDSVRELLLAGAKVNHQKHDNVTALHVASFAGYTDVVHSLMLSKADVNLKDKCGMTSLMFASKQGHLDVVMRLLKDKNLDVNAQEDEAKFSAPFFAIQCKHLNILHELLKSKRVDCEKTDLKGKTLWNLTEINNYDDARQLFKQNYHEEMKLMKSINPQPSVPVVCEGPPPTVKTMLQGSDSSTLYITRMLQNIDNRMGGDTAGAA